MAITAAEVRVAQEELSRLNEQLGFPRRAPQDTPGGGSASPREEGPALAGPTNDLGKVGSPSDPGPPRFVGVDLDAKIAGLSGGGLIPIGSIAMGKICDILLGELRLSLNRTLGEVASSHGRPATSEQIDIPFEDSSDVRDPT